MNDSLEVKVEKYFCEHEKDKTDEDKKRLEDIKEQIRRKIPECNDVRKEFSAIEERINNGEEDLLQIWWGQEARVLEKEFELTDLMETYDNLVKN